MKAVYNNIKIAAHRGSEWVKIMQGDAITLYPIRGKIDSPIESGNDIL